MTDYKTVLLTDGEFTGMIRTLRSLSEPPRILGFVSSGTAAHTAFLDGYAVAPDWRDKDYLPFLIDYVKREHVDLIFPVITSSLEFMAQNADKIREETGAVLISSPAESIHIANNKVRLFETLSHTELSKFITPFAAVNTVGEMRKAVKAFEEQGISCISKPACGENAEGFIKYVTGEEYAEKRLLGQASNLATLSSFHCLSAESPLPESRLIMPYLPG